MTEEPAIVNAQAPEEPATVHGAYGPFAYLSAPNAALYRRIMKALMALKQRFAVHVRAEDITRTIADDGDPPVENDAVTDALERLAQPSWGNLLAFPDSSRVTALEDFYRRRMLFQLTSEGEAAERALAQYDSALGSRGALQSVALEDIIALLRELRDALPRGEGATVIDEAKVHQSLRNLRGRFVELAENAVAFMGSIQRTIDLHDADIDAFVAYKEQLIAYLERFINDLLTRGAVISELIEGFSDSETQILAETAAQRELLDAAPGEEERVRTSARANWLSQWSGLKDWFVSSSTRESEARLLRSRARSAIPALLNVVRTLHEKNAGRSDRAEDFLTLARWFASLPSEADHHRLWRSAFSLTSARHLSVTSKTADSWEEANLGNATPWAMAPPVEISPQLRKSGSYERRGRAARVIDRSAEKALLLSRAREEAEQTARARARILTDGPMRLSTFGELDPGSFRLFLALLGDALASMAPGERSTQVFTSDGELSVSLTRCTDSQIAVIRTSDGDLSGPDHLVDISPAFSQESTA